MEYPDQIQLFYFGPRAGFIVSGITVINDTDAAGKRREEDDSVKMVDSFYHGVQRQAKISSEIKKSIQLALEKVAGVYFGFSD